MMICRLEESCISEKLRAPWTEERPRVQVERKSRDQTVRQPEHILNNLSNMQRVGDVYEKQAPMSHSLLSPRSEPSFLSQNRISAFRSVIAHQEHVLLWCSNITLKLWYFDLVWLREISADSFVALSSAKPAKRPKDKAYIAPAGSFETLGKVLEKTKL